MLLHLHLDPNLVLEPLNIIGRNAERTSPQGRKVAQLVATHNMILSRKMKKGGETLKPKI